MKPTKQLKKKSDCLYLLWTAHGSIKNNWSALMMDAMKQHCSGMQDQGMEMGMYGVGFELLAVGQLPELRIRGAAQTA